MSGRIRSIKPEWLEDERMATASSEARVLSIALLCLADDYGRGRADRMMTALRVFPPASEDPTLVAKSLDQFDSASSELAEIGYVQFYKIGGQRYFAVRNWDKHQKVTHPGRPIVPGPNGESVEANPEAKTYIARRGTAGPIKIGFSIDPEARAQALSKTQPERVVILATIPGRKHEKQLHRRFSHLRIEETEWFEPGADLLEFIASTEWAMPVQCPSNARPLDASEVLTPDLRPTTNDQRPTMGVDLTARTHESQASDDAPLPPPPPVKAHRRSDAATPIAPPPVVPTLRIAPKVEHSEPREPIPPSESIVVAPLASRRQRATDDLRDCPISELAGRCRANPHDAALSGIGTRPELVRVNMAWSRSVGLQPRPLGAYTDRNRPLLALLEAFEVATEEDLLRVCGQAGRDDWCTGRKGTERDPARKRDVGCLTQTVLSRLLEAAEQHRPKFVNPRVAAMLAAEKQRKAGQL